MVQITTNPTHLTLQAPFHPSLSFHAKALNGRWKGQEIGWLFGHEHDAALRALCVRLWGVDGTPEAMAELVDLRITVEQRDIHASVWSAQNEALYLVGREIAASLKNRRAARPGRGVKFLRGQPCCKAELNHYWTSIPDGSVFTIKDVPVMAVAHMQRAVTGHGTIEQMAA